MGFKLNPRGQKVKQNLTVFAGGYSLSCVNLLLLFERQINFDPVTGTDNLVMNLVTKLTGFLALDWRHRTAEIFINQILCPISSVSTDSINVNVF